MVDYEETNKKNQKLCDTDHDTFYLLESLEFPMTKFILESSNVTNIGRFILLMWINIRLHNLSITAARDGLKKCGAVNLICFETNCVRPLPDLYIIIQQNIKNKNQNERSGLMDQKPRIKNSFYWSAINNSKTICHSKRHCRVSSVFISIRYHKRNSKLWVSHWFFIFNSWYHGYPSFRFS